MNGYLDLVEWVLEGGHRSEDRTGVGTLCKFGAHQTYDLREGFPLVTTKKILFSSVVKELLWFLSGSTSTKDLDCRIWDAWGDEEGELGPVYGAQFRSYGGRGIDQIQNALDLIKNDPSSRRIIVNAWNPLDIEEMALPPCHVLMQFHCEGEYLDLQLYQRSADLALGVPFNIASYSLLLMMFAQECGRTPRFFHHAIGNLHIYRNHVDGLAVQLRRELLELPSVVLADKPVLEMTYEDVQLVKYRHHPAIKFEIAI